MAGALFACNQYKDRQKEAIQAEKDRKNEKIIKDLEKKQGALEAKHEEQQEANAKQQATMAARQATVEEILRKQTGGAGASYRKEDLVTMELAKHKAELKELQRKTGARP